MVKHGVKNVKQESSPYSPGIKNNMKSTNDVWVPNNSLQLKISQVHSDLKMLSKKRLRHIDSQAVLLGVENTVELVTKNARTGNDQHL